LARSQDRKDAVATILEALTLPSFYVEALEDPVVAKLLDDQRVWLTLPRDGTAKIGEVSWSPRLQRIAWFQQLTDSNADVHSSRLVVQTLGGHVDHVEFVDAKIAQRYLRDMGFRPGRELKNLPPCDDTGKTNLRAWRHAIRSLGVPGLRI